jgi:hypothetical protein
MDTDAENRAYSTVPNQQGWCLETYRIGRCVRDIGAFVRTRTERETHSAQLLPFMEDRSGRREGTAGAANEFTYGTVEAYACEGERG